MSYKQVNGKWIQEGECEASVDFHTFATSFLAVTQEVEAEGHKPADRKAEAAKTAAVAAETARWERWDRDQEA